MKKKVNPALSREAHLSPMERKRLGEVLSPSLGGNTVRERGIDAGELKRIKTALETTPDRFKIIKSKERLKKAEDILDRNL